MFEHNGIKKKYKWIFVYQTWIPNGVSHGNQEIFSDKPKIVESLLQSFNDTLVTKGIEKDTIILNIIRVDSD